MRGAFPAAGWEQPATFSPGPPTGGRCGHLTGPVRDGISGASVPEVFWMSQVPGGKGWVWPGAGEKPGGQWNGPDELSPTVMGSLLLLC